MNINFQALGCRLNEAELETWASEFLLQGHQVTADSGEADIVVFNPETVIDRATFEEPHQLSVGIEHVLVNGVPVVRAGRHTGATPGKAVRGPGWRGWN